MASGVPYYERFMARFPTVEQLAAAREEEVLKAWEGLGFYGRARNLHRAAKAITAGHRGDVPTNFADLRALPGIGDYTAGARIYEQVKPVFKSLLDDIQTGTFARNWILENQAGRPNFYAQREIEARHPIEKVGAELRSMMSWLKKGDH